MNAADVILCASLLGLAAALMLCLKAWEVMRRASRYEKRLKRKCAELSAACERAYRAGDLLPADRKHKEVS